MIPRLFSLSRRRAPTRLQISRSRQRTGRFYSVHPRPPAASKEDQDIPQLPTISDRERQAFENVLKKVVAAETKSPKPFSADNFAKSEAAIGRFPDALKSLVQTAEHEVLLRQFASARREHQHEDETTHLTPEEAAVLQKAREKSHKTYTEITETLSKAQTDSKLLDSLESLFQSAERYEADPGKDTSLAVLLENHYSQILVFALTQLDSHFANSPVAFHILHRIKSIGPRSHALGASTELYNLSIEIAWKYYGNVNQVINLIDEMDRHGLDFDGRTLGIVDSILKSSQSVGLFGSGQQRSDQAASTNDLKDRRVNILQRIGEADVRNAAALLEMKEGPMSASDEDGSVEYRLRRT